MTAYGGKGCSCWPDVAGPHDTPTGAWMPNAGCHFHGLLAGYVPPRTDTGTYRVDLSTPPDGPECPPGVHSMFDPCPGGCMEDLPEEECTGCGDGLAPCEDCEVITAIDLSPPPCRDYQRTHPRKVRRLSWWRKGLARACLWLWRDR